MEGHNNRSDSLIPVFDKDAAHTIHYKWDDSQDAKCPGQAKVGNHGVCGQWISEPAKARTTSGDGVGKGAFFNEPLRNNTTCGDEAKPKAYSKTEALAEEEVPNMGRKGSTDERDPRERIWPVSYMFTEAKMCKESSGRPNNLRLKDNATPEG
jgi:hypothetical protein